MMKTTTLLLLMLLTIPTAFSMKAALGHDDTTQGSTLRCCCGSTDIKDLACYQQQLREQAQGLAIYLLFADEEQSKTCSVTDDEVAFQLSLLKPEYQNSEQAKRNARALASLRDESFGYLIAKVMENLKNE